MMSRRSWLGVAVSALSVATASSANAAPASDLAPELEPLRRKYDLPALAAAVVKAGVVVAAGVTGVRAIGREDKAQIGDRFHLGSDTKAMTATLAGAMVDEGKLGWNTTIGETLGGSTPGIHPALAAVTLEQLLCHSSGIPTDTPEMLDIYFSADALKLNIADTRLSAFAKGKGHAPATPPGAEFHYANFGYLIAGVMIERAAGVSWEELIVARLFSPLGLASAGLGPQASVGRLDAAVGHDPDGDGAPLPMWWGPAADVPPVLGPVGSAHMSVLDFALWAGWNAAAGKRGPALVKPETLAYIHAPKINTGRIPNPRPGTPAEGEYALGWGLAKFDWTSAPVLTHNGSNGFNLAKILVDSPNDFAVTALTNIAGAKADEGVGDAIENLYKRFL